MSKELPYFKFEPSSWDNGNIQACSKISKGLFIDLCSMYWARLGELPYALALQKHCNGNANEMQELIEHEIIIIDGDNIVIEFLDEQLTEFIQVSEKRKDAANKRWDAKAMQKQCKSNAIKRREEKIKKEKIYSDETQLLYSDLVVLFDEKLRPASEIEKKKWLDVCERLLKDNSHEHIKTIVKKARMDDFWGKQFLSLNKLIKSDKDGVNYFVKFELKFMGKTERREQDRDPRFNTAAYKPLRPIE